MFRRYAFVGAISARNVGEGGEERVLVTESGYEKLLDFDIGLYREVGCL